jgi:hypothetical protein
LEFRLSFKVVRVALQLYYLLCILLVYFRIFLDREKKEARKLLPIF